MGIGILGYLFLGALVLFFFNHPRVLLFLVTPVVGVGVGGFFWGLFAILIPSLNELSYFIGFVAVTSFLWMLWVVSIKD